MVAAEWITKSIETFSLPICKEIQQIEIGRNFSTQQDNGPKRSSNTTKGFHRGKRVKALDWLNQSSDRNLVKHVFYLLKRRLNEETSENKQQWKEDEVQFWYGIAKEKTECNSLVTTADYRIYLVVAGKWYATKYETIFNTVCSYTFRLDSSN